MPTEKEVYLMRTAREAGEVSELLGRAAEIVERSEKDQKPAYTNPQAAANIKNRTPEYIKTLNAIISALVKKYGRTKEIEGLMDTLKRLYKNLLNASKYLQVPGVQEEVRKSAYEMLKALPKND